MTGRAARGAEGSCEGQHDGRDQQERRDERAKERDQHDQDGEQCQRHNDKVVAACCSPLVVVLRSCAADEGSGTARCVRCLSQGRDGVDCLSREGVVAQGQLDERPLAVRLDARETGDKRRRPLDARRDELRRFAADPGEVDARRRGGAGRKAPLEKPLAVNGFDLLCELLRSASVVFSCDRPRPSAPSANAIDNHVRRGLRALTSPNLRQTPCVAGSRCARRGV